MFGCTYLGDGEPRITGNVQSLTGQPGTIVAGKNYSYLYKKLPDNYVDYIGANGGTIIFKSQDGKGRAVNYNGANNSYRSIHSAFIFGAIRGGSNVRNELMRIYLNYLLGGPEIAEVLPSHLSVNLYPNPFSDQLKITFSLSNPDLIKVILYNPAGMVVAKIVEEKIAPGEHQIIWRPDRRLKTGLYLLWIETSRGVVSRPVILLR
ncbi:hypothetical protein DRP53_09370 [candidate division WOR-3 bacterium]|uniref:T9SS type A sorting domain-containing protein n=1 Tax=candidate division WOR-3 bacterium TaxID=2052148 RepID=A0A660SE20_UNCW3|nr:MAG: hypothetical protein DRP53_09370 [candidate division WOR-3 bacterium]